MPDFDDSDAAPVIEGYDTGQLIGRGGQATVWLVRRGDGSEYAAKVLRAETPSTRQEISVLQSLSHEHLLPLLEVVPMSDGAVALIFPLASGGSVAATLEHRGHLTVGELVTVLCPIARALHDVHALGFVHADISPSNILLTGDGKPMLADIGASRLAGQLHENSWATESWAAPEVLAGELPTPSADVYSLGAIAWAAVTGAAPEPAALRPRLEELAPHLDATLADLINSCLSFTPAARPSPADFAARLWACAPAEPAPRAGLRAGLQAGGGQGSGNAECGDTAMELTRRIRAAARHDPAVTESPTGAPADRSRRWVGVVAVAGLAVALSGGAIWALRHASPAGAAQPSVAASPAASQTAPTPVAPRAAAAATSTSAPASATPVISPDPVRLNPNAVVQALIDQRAAAWMSPGHAELAAAMIPDSPAWKRDSADLAKADAESVRYRNLRFVVKSAHVTHGDAREVVVRAQLQRQAYDVVTGGTVQQRPQDAVVTTELTLRHTADGWRLSDWGAVAGS